MAKQWLTFRQEKSYRGEVPQMQKLTGLDEMFLSVDEAGTTNGVMGGLVIYERPTTPGAAGAEAMVERIEDRLEHLPFLRWKLARTPLGLDHFRWVEAGRVEIADHVRTIRLPGKGDDRLLAAEVASIMEVALPKDRPLWELVVIEGLAKGRIAHLLRIHHGLIDGSSVPTVLDILSDNPTPGLGFATKQRWHSDLLTGRIGLTGRGLVATAVRPVKFAGLQVKTVRFLASRAEEDGRLRAAPAFAGRILPGPLGAPFRGLANLRRSEELPPVQSVVPTLRKPATPFNGRVESARSYAFSDLPLADFKTVGKAFGVTLNDVVIAVVAGSLRRYLEERGGIPEQPLVVCIPASLRTGEERPYWANHVFMFFAELPTDVEDPIERLHEARARVRAGKQTFDATPARLVREASEFIFYPVWSLPQRVLSKAPRRYSPSMWNVVVSNVRGPANPVSVTGATMAGYWPAAFLTMGLGLNITLQSYVDRVDFGFMGATNLTGDLWELPDHMATELALLLEAARQKTAAEESPTVVKPLKKTKSARA
jgi:diacylglycerol O-acyltransferase / wax synthase